MKNYKNIWLAGIVLLLFACNKVKITAPDIQVSANKTTVKVGDTVTFSFKGNADNIAFWSGEPGNAISVGHVYANRNRLIAKMPGVLNQLIFTSNVQSGLVSGVNGTVPGATYQTNNLALFISTNFNGKMDSTSVRNATWTDITSRAILGTTTTNVSSGTINLSDFQQAADSVYIAYRYLSTTSTPSSIAPQWTVAGFVYTNLFPDSTSYVYNTINSDIRYAGFQPVTIKNPSLIWNITGTMVFPTGFPGQSDEDWAISLPFNLYRTVPDVANSNPTVIKDISKPLTNFTYAFAKPGIYTVSFVASNVSDAGEAEVVRELKITVTP
jgi:hypothetical protein